MAPKLKQLLQIGIFVKNADECVKYYEEKMGMGPWHVSIMSGKNIPDLYQNGEHVEGDLMKVCILNAYGVEFEIIEPLCDGPIKDWVEEHGNGIHHLAFVTEDDYDTMLDNYKNEKGVDKPWNRGQGHNSLMDFSYLDMRDEMGIFLECYRNIMPNRPRLDF